MLGTSLVTLMPPNARVRGRRPASAAPLACIPWNPKSDRALRLGDEPALDITVEPNRLIELVCLLALRSG